MEDSLNLLIEYVQHDGRVCPMPTFWHELWEMLPNRKRKTNGECEPSLPLILAAWWDTTVEQKRERLIEHIRYAANHGILDKVEKFLRELAQDQWTYGDGTTKWESHA